MNKVYLYVGLWVLNIFDCLTTMAIINLAGIEAEANPIMRWILVNWGVGGMWVVKGSILSLLAAFKLDTFSTHFWIVLNTIFSLVVIFNLIGLILL